MVNTRPKPSSIGSSLLWRCTIHNARREACTLDKCVVLDVQTLLPLEWRVPTSWISILSSPTMSKKAWYKNGAPCVPCETRSMLNRAFLKAKSSLKRDLVADWGSDVSIYRYIIFALRSIIRPYMRETVPCKLESKNIGF